jgi:hypothetical protein
VDGFVDIVSNPASRISHIIDLAASANHPHAYGIWREALQISEEHGKDQAYVELAQRLVWLNAELDEFVAYFEAVPNFPKPYFMDAVAPVRAAISPRMLSGNQSQLRQLLGDAPRVTFRLLGQQMPSDGAPVDATELDDLLQLVAQLRAAIETSSLSARLRLMIERQLRLLVRAIDAYPIRGSRAFQDSFNDMSGELMSFVFDVEQGKDAEAVDAATSKEVGLMFLAAKKIRDIAAKIEKIRPYLQLATDTLKLVHEAKSSG